MKNDKKAKVNQLFSSFLVIGFIICTYFFLALANQVQGVGGYIISVAVPLLFGLILFYATRVGEGEPVKRFSLSVLLLVDLPALYIILASFVKFLPLNEQLSANSTIYVFAAIALGYGIPYTFLSGFEMKNEEEAESTEMVEGGLEEELSQAEAENAEETADEAAEEIADEETADEAAKEEEPADEEKADDEAQEAADEEKTAEAD